MPPKRKSPKKGAKAKGGKGARTSMRVESKRSGFALTKDRNLGGTEDAEITTLVWETIASSSLSAGSDLLFCIKGNSLYRPGGIATFGLGLTTNPVGYARMYTQYTVAHVISSKIQLWAWATSGTIAGGVPSVAVVNVPLRLACVPSTVAAASIYASGNTASLAGYPHATTSFSNNTVRTTNRGNSGLITTGVGRPVDAEMVTGDYSAATGGDPAAPWYYTIGLGNTSTALNATNYELRIVVSYKVRWYEPVAQAVLLMPRDKFGNEQSSAPASRAESKGDSKASVVLKLTQEEAFEDWTDAESEFASFKELCAIRRKAIAKTERISPAVESKTAAKSPS